MYHTGNGIWKLELANQPDQNFENYRYGVQQPDGSIMYETGASRKLRLPETKKHILFRDTWRGPTSESPFNAFLFAELFLKRNELKHKSNKGEITLRLHCPKMQPHNYIAISGNQEILGNWNESALVRMNESHFPDWEFTLPLSKITFPLEYKYLVLDGQSNSICEWEAGENRRVESTDKQTNTIIGDEHLRVSCTNWKGAGVAIPVFSLRSKKSFGIGEFNDLKLMVDWAKRTGQRMIQTLPINDTTLNYTNGDSYPYNAVSVYALHPVYLNLDKMGKLNDTARNSFYSAKQKELNEKETVDYEAVINTKWACFLEIFAQNSKRIFAQKEYKLFFEKNKEWLVPYAAFSHLRDVYGTPEFTKWTKYSVYNPAEIEKLAQPQSENYEKLALYYFLQYHLHLQLSEVHAYATANSVALKGDIPIGVSPHSVDAWVDPQLFNTQMQAGAPPDDFSVTGQNWGFPTYNWEKMEEDGYSWWKKRFAKLAEYFDAYRIDHILGFFRIWEIPTSDVWGLTGNFHPALPYSIKEIEQAGIVWDEDRLTKPFINETVINALFGEKTEFVKKEFLVPNGDFQYSFKPNFDTQRKIKEHFGYHLTQAESVLRDGLYALHSEVLFLRDKRDSEKFHPRISMHNSHSFKALNNEQKQNFDRLYVEYFYRRHNEFWRDKAYEKLPPLLSATNMLVCGEDLGMVPATVPEVMQALEILSLEIQRMPKAPNVEFGLPADAPYLSVCTTSTHDMNPIRAWWEENPIVSQRFFNQILGFEGDAPAKCEQWLAEKIVQQHLESNAMWVILPWQDWMATETQLCAENPKNERINVPDNPNNFWCYRMHIPLEKLLKEQIFNDRLKKMVEKAGR